MDPCEGHLRKASDHHGRSIGFARRNSRLISGFPGSMFCEKKSRCSYRQRMFRASPAPPSSMLLPQGGGPNPAKKSPADVKQVLLEGVSKSCEKKSRRCQSLCSWASLANIEIGGIGGIIPIPRSVQRDFFSQNMDSDFAGLRPTLQTLLRSSVRVTSGYMGIWE